jgi:hypothetical protein
VERSPGKDREKLPAVCTGLKFGTQGLSSVEARTGLAGLLFRKGVPGLPMEDPCLGRADTRNPSLMGCVPWCEEVVNGDQLGSSI